MKSNVNILNNILEYSVKEMVIDYDDDNIGE